MAASSGRRICGIGLIAALVLSVPTGASSATARTAPYDFSCNAGNAPDNCLVPWPGGKETGRADAYTGIGVGIVYGPPFVWPRRINGSAYTGIYVNVPHGKRLRVTAICRGLASPSVRAQVRIHLYKGSQLFTDNLRELPATTDPWPLSMTTDTLPGGTYNLRISPEIYYRPQLEYGVASVVIERIEYTFT